MKGLIEASIPILPILNITKRIGSKAISISNIKQLDFQHSQWFFGFVFPFFFKIAVSLFLTISEVN